MIAARPAQTPEYYLTPDCPMEGQELEARYGGKDAKRLGLTDKPFGTLSFLRLAKGLNPDTGDKLTARLKADRKEATDICVTVPKAVSVLIEVAGDQRVKEALWEANNHAMRLWEKKAKVRERKGGVHRDRETGTMMWASFYHGTTRSISEKRDPSHASFYANGVEILATSANDNQPHPDPHSHIHNYVMNLSYDPVEKTHKAMKRHHYDLPEIEAEFNKRLAKNLRGLGYDAKAETKVIHYKSKKEVPLELQDQVQPGRKPKYVTSKLHVAGISDEVQSVFTRRQDEIKSVENSRDGDGQSMSEKYRAKASQIIRAPKSLAAGMTRETLHRHWVSRLTGGQFADLADAVAKARSSVTLSRWRDGLKQNVARLQTLSMMRGETHERGRDQGRGR